jgi:hypothetical protein
MKKIYQTSGLLGNTERVSSIQLPHIRVNVVRKNSENSIINELPIPYTIKLDDPLSLNPRPHFPSSQKFRKKIKNSEILNETTKKLENYSFIVLQPVIEESEKYKPQDTISDDHNSPKNLNKTIQKTLKQIELNSKIIDPSLIKDNIISPSLDFPIRFKAKKNKKKNPSFEYSSNLYEKFFIEPNTKKTQKLEKILKTSARPESEFKVPNYIRHESYKAGFFHNKIDKFMTKLRGQRSKSSINSYSPIKVGVIN